MLSSSKAPKTQQITVTDKQEKSVDFFYGVATLAPEIILLAWVPLQKFPFLFNLQFLTST